jgi:hypothetical protein
MSINIKASTDGTQAIIGVGGFDQMTVNNNGHIILSNGSIIASGTSSPENVVIAPVGSIYTNTSGSTLTTLYIKTSGSGNTGWTAK